MSFGPVTKLQTVQGALSFSGVDPLNESGDFVSSLLNVSASFSCLESGTGSDP